MGITSDRKSLRETCGSFGEAVAAMQRTATLPALNSYLPLRGLSMAWWIYDRVPYASLLILTAILYNGCRDSRDPEESGSFVILNDFDSGNQSL